MNFFIKLLIVIKSLLVSAIVGFLLSPPHTAIPACTPENLGIATKHSHKLQLAYRPLRENKSNDKINKLKRQVTTDSDRDISVINTGCTVERGSIERVALWAGGITPIRTGTEGSIEITKQILPAKQILAKVESYDGGIQIVTVVNSTQSGEKSGQESDQSITRESALRVGYMQITQILISIILVVSLYMAVIRFL